MTKFIKLTLIAVPCFLLILSCGGGSDGGGDDDGGSSSPSLTAGYTADLTTVPSAGNVSLEYNVTLSSASQPVFDVIIYGLLDNSGVPDNRVYGIAFHLSFDDTMLSYIGTDFTDALGTVVNTDTAAASGVLTVGMSKTGTVVGTEIPESGTVMMSITFKAMAAGSSNIEFLDLVAGSDCGTAGHSECNVILNADTPVGLDVSTGWFGGSIDIT